MNAIFNVPNSGLIQVKSLPSGDITVTHTGGSDMFEMVNGVCHSGRGYWKSEFRNWIIFERFANEVIVEFERLAVRIS